MKLLLYVLEQLPGLKINFHKREMLEKQNNMSKNMLNYLVVK
jgi:hypothetical protein